MRLIYNYFFTFLKVIDTSRCHDYFPSLDSPVREFDSFNVVLKEEQDFDDYVIRDLELLQKTGDLSSEKDGSNEPLSRKVKHFHFISWPDFGNLLFFLFLKKQIN